MSLISRVTDLKQQHAKQASTHTKQWCKVACAITNQVVALEDFGFQISCKNYNMIAEKGEEYWEVDFKLGWGCLFDMFIADPGGPDVFVTVTTQDDCTRTFYCLQKDVGRKLEDVLAHALIDRGLA